MMIYNANCDKVAVENPIGVMSTRFRKPDQYIQPWMFGHPERKKTGLWLKGLPLLKGTDNVYEEMISLPNKLAQRVLWLGHGHQKERSVTYPGIAKAMAEQWAGREMNK